MTVGDVINQWIYDFFTPLGITNVFVQAGIMFAVFCFVMWLLFKGYTAFCDSIVYEDE